MVLREFFAKLGLDVDAASFAKGELAAGLVQGALAKVASAAGEAVTKFVDLIQQTAEAGKEISETSQATGLTTKSLQELRDVAGGLGVDSGTLDVGLFRLSRTMKQVKDGAGSAGTTFGKLKTKVTDSHGKLRSTDEVLLDLANGFSKMPDGAEKTATAMEIFGRSGARLIPILNKGRDGLEELRAETTVMTDEQVAAGKEMQETQYALGLVTRNLWRGAIAPLLPAINALMKRYLEWRKAGAAVMRQRIEKYIGYLIRAVNWLGDAWTFLEKNMTGIKVLLGVLATFFGLLEIRAVAAAVKTMLSWGLAAAPFLLLAAAVAGVLLVMDDLRRYAKGGKGKTVFGEFKKNIAKWANDGETKPWWFRAMQGFVELIEEAIDLLDTFDEKTSRWNPQKADKAAGKTKAQIQADADATTIKSARIRAAQGLPMTDAAKAALARQGNVTPEAFQARYQQAPEYLRASAPEVAAPPGVQQAGPYTVSNTVTVNVPPGTSQQAGTQMVQDALSQAMSGHYADLAASAVP